MFVCFVDLEKAFDRMEWNRLLEILRIKGVDWKERRLIKNLYMNQSVIMVWEQAETRKIKLGRGVRQGCCLSPTLFNVYSSEMLKECIDGVRGIGIGGKRVECLRFADDMAVMAENELELLDMMKDLERACLKYGMKINVKKTKVMMLGRISKTINLTIEGKRLEEVKQFRYLECLISLDCKCEKEIRTRIAMAKEAFRKHYKILTGPLELRLRKRLLKCLIWNVVLYGAETWTLRKRDEERLQAFEMWAWRKLEKISWTRRIRNEKVLRMIGEKRHCWRQLEGEKEIGLDM